MTAAERYRLQKQTASEPEIVDVPAPSGFIFKFEKPSKYSIIFGMGGLPTAAVARAVESWQQQGVLTKEEVSDDLQEPDGAKIIKTVLGLRDQVLKLSHSPKLVVGIADEGKDELSTDDVSGEDLEFLLSWVASGGTASAQLATFPGGSSAGTLASANGKKRRATAK